MKMTIVPLIITTALLISACNVPDSYSEITQNTQPTSSISRGGMPIASIPYRTFERALLELTTDVVIAQYVGCSILEIELIEYEFIVIDRVLGNTTDSIFVYDHSNVLTNILLVDSDGEVIGELIDDSEPELLPLSPGSIYLLPLNRISTAYARRMHDDLFWFSSQIVIDLNDIANSTMRFGSLSEHSTGFDFSCNATQEQIIAYVYDLTKNNPPIRGIIRSPYINDIINVSPHVVVIEIGEPRFLASELEHGGGSDIDVATDSYYATVNRVLKGTLQVGDEIEINFFAETVFTGEQHIVAIEPFNPGSIWFNFTSRNSLFRIDQLDEIMEIIETGNDTDDPIEIPSPTPDPTPTIQPGLMFSLNTQDIGDQFRIWTRVGRVNAAIPITYTPPDHDNSVDITVIDQNGNDAMSFVKINWVNDRPQDGMVSYFDIAKTLTVAGVTTTWVKIDFTVTSGGQIVELSLTNN